MKTGIQPAKQAKATIYAALIQIPGLNLSPRQSGYNVLLDDNSQAPELMKQIHTLFPNFPVAIMHRGNEIVVRPVQEGIF